jgi:solute carrier family 12 sodium/potassium/chloride transporter 2
LSSDDGSHRSSIPTIDVLNIQSPKKGKGKKQKKVEKNKSSGLPAYSGNAANPISPDDLARVTQFTQKQKKGTIDVWWLYDDGGLTILLPHILTTRSQFSECELRIFTLSKGLDELGSTQINMATLLSKFRIDYSGVTVIPDITTKAKDSTKKEFETLIKPFMDDDSTDGTSISSADIVTHREKINRHLRLHELLLEHSKDSTFVVMTLPVPRKENISAPLYMAWLEMVTKDMPPFLLVRGNQTSVLTFYS